MPIEKGESIYFSVGVEPVNPISLPRFYRREINRRIPRDSFENCLLNAAQQFVVKRGKKVEIIAGYPWFGRWGRDTFVALPGLTMVPGELKSAKAVIDGMLEELKGPLFPNRGIGEKAIYNSADTPLWFFWAVQQYGIFNRSTSRLWKDYSAPMKAILRGYREGTLYNIKLHDNHLIYAGDSGFAVTWMDAVVDGKPVTPRIGYCVEINSLWYNALMFAIQLATEAGDQEFVNEWSDHADAFPKAFIDNFWYDDKKYLADYTNGDYKDYSVRPNQVLATSLPYSPLPEEMRNGILERVKSELLTPRGLRSLAPKNPLYKGMYEGNQSDRDLAYHNGSVHPWLLGHFVEGFLKIHGKSGLQLVKDIYNGFETELNEYGIGTISEVFDGDPPHRPAGAISQAWCVAEVLRMNWLIKQEENK
jgi:predicted glycogen debranching enzyme